MRTTIGSERLMSAPADVIYHCIADYAEHHRPGGFLPAAFTDLEILQGGIGSGTKYRFTLSVGGRRRTFVAAVDEPVPGRQLVETGPGIRTSFTVSPVPDGSLVRFETVMETGGLEGLLNRLFARRLLLPIYEDELRRLDRHAQDHGPIAATSRHEQRR